jgi:hypothetical protein
MFKNRKLSDAHKIIAEANKKKKQQIDQRMYSFVEGPDRSGLAVDWLDPNRDLARDLRATPSSMRAICSAPVTGRNTAHTFPHTGKSMA